MKKLYVTNEIPTDAAILLVDVQKEFFDESFAHQEDEHINVLEKRIETRLQIMKNKLTELKTKGHPILAVGGDSIYEGFELLPNVILPNWNYDYVQPEEDFDTGGGFVMDPAIVEEVGKYKDVIVCGLWKELCVYMVSRSLQKVYGDKVKLFTDESLTLENALVWLDDDVLTLEGVCENDKVEIIND